MYLPIKNRICIDDGMRLNPNVGNPHNGLDQYLCVNLSGINCFKFMIKLHLFCVKYGRQDNFVLT